MAGSGSGLYLNGVLSHSSWTSSTRPTKRARTHRSVFNSTDDWDELVAASTLSTASVSSRPARPRGLQTLAICAEHAAVRNFKRLYEEGKIRSPSGAVGKGWWEVEWELVPDHLKAKVRDGVFRRYGSVLKLDMIRDLFIVPPHLEYPGHLIPALSSATLKSISPSREVSGSITSLSIRHLPQMSDAAIANLIDHLPNLELLNLKGCSLVTAQTAQAIIKRCPKIRGLNLKGTKLGEADLVSLLQKYGDQLERLKVDVLVCQNPDTVFIAPIYPRLTHLCIPGDLINGTESARARARQSGHTLAYPTPRPSRANAAFDWPYFDKIFPSLTHLYLPGLLIPVGTAINLTSGRLIKLSLGSGGPPVPIPTLVNIIQGQKSSLKSLHLRHLLPIGDEKEAFESIGDILEQCVGMEDFRFAADPGGSQDSLCDRSMKRSSGLTYTFSKTPPFSDRMPLLKHLHLLLPSNVSTEAFSINPQCLPIETVPPLEYLSLPSANIIDTAAFTQSIAGRSGFSGYRNLRFLDLSGTSITTEQVFTILDTCQLLSRIDLTSCRGVGVRLRRNIFEAWAADRAEKRGETEVEEENANRRSKRKRK